MQFHGLKLLVDRIEAEHQATKDALAFATKFVERKYRHGSEINKEEFIEFLNGISEKVATNGISEKVATNGK